MLKKKIGFIGTGQAARAMAKGFVAAKLVKPENVHCYDPSPRACKEFSELIPGTCIHKDNEAVVAESDVIVLAVKPQIMDIVLEQLHHCPKEGKLFISIAAGIPLVKLIKGLTTERIVRVMPNTPCLISQCAAGYCLASGATTEDSKVVHRLLESVGIAFELDESLLNAVTGLSGSGPAYVYVIIEALSDAGVQMGLPRQVASALAAQTVRGAAELMLATGEHPAVLKDAVCSPGGTTISGLRAMEKGGLRSTIISAVEAATARAEELGRGHYESQDD